MFTTYILFSESRDNYYIGSTGDDIAQRIRRHNSNHKGYTGTVRDWKLVYSETFESKTDALSREREIKKWKSRSKIIKLITRV